MIKVALKGLAGRKVRALLTALAVVIGVSMVSGTFVLTDTMKKAFDGIFTESYAGTDAVVSGRQLVDFSSGGRATVRADLLEKVKRLDSVEAASGSLIDLQSNSNPAKLLDKQGQIIGRDGETLGVGIDDSGRQFSPLKLKQGAWAHGDGEIVLDAGTASKQHFKVGDAIRVSGNGPAKSYKITGVASFGSVDSLGSASIAVFDLPGEYDGLAVTLSQILFPIVALLGVSGIVVGILNSYEHFSVPGSRRRRWRRTSSRCCRRPPTSRPATTRPRPTPRTPTRA